jgi:hypothetical protein
MTEEIILDDRWGRKSQAVVTLYSRGCMMTSPVGQTSQKKHGSGGIRGTIRGFSYASRRRMRHFLMTHDAPGRMTYNVTFTLPTTDIDDSDERAIFARWSSDAVHAGWSAVWRLQVQKRGTRHWHLLVAIPPDLIARELRAVPPPASACRSGGGRGALLGPPDHWTEKTLWQLGRFEVIESWARACDSLGEVGIKIGQRSDGSNVIGRGKVSQAMGFDLHAVDVQGEHDGQDHDRMGSAGGAWCRYLCDHATRTAQEAVGKGRQWGIVGRSGFVRLHPDDVYKLTDQEYAKFRRAYERLATASRMAPESVFGSKLGRRVKRGRRGTAASFVRPDTVKRLIEWAATPPF